MAVRKIKASARSITGIHGQTGQEFESSLEQNMIRLLHFDPYVDSFETQPLTIRYTNAGKRRTYTPDILIHFKKDAPHHPRRAKPLLCEIKYRCDYRVKFTEISIKVRAALHYAKLKQFRFDVITDREINTQYLKNVIFLNDYRPREFDAEELDSLVGVIAKLSPTTPKHLLDHLTTDLEQQATYIPMLWHLVSTFKVITDLKQKLTMKSTIWPNKGEDDLCQFISSPVL